MTEKKAEKKMSTTSTTTEEKKSPKPTEEPTLLEVIESEIDAFFESLDELPDDEKLDVIQYVANRVTKQGYAVIKIEEMDDTVPQFNSAQLFNDAGSSKNLRLDVLKSMTEAQRRGEKPILCGDSTAHQLVRRILNRAGLPDSPQKEDLVKIFARALLINIPDPFSWQNPLWKPSNR